MAELLIWPALIAYGEAAVAYAGELRGPGRAGRLGTWGVRIGWLAQTALLAVQALSSDGFPWGTWAGALNLFVWLVVGVYLIWGCRPRYRLLGLAVMPIAAALLLLAWLGGGTGVDSTDHSGVLLGIHVALMLAGLAGFTVAGGMAALYLWEERRLSDATPACSGSGSPRSRHSTGCPRVWLPRAPRAPHGGHRRRPDDTRPR